jgi:hypothetical protein
MTFLLLHNRRSAPGPALCNQVASIWEYLQALQHMTLQPILAPALCALLKNMSYDTQLVTS